MEKFQRLGSRNGGSAIAVLVTLVSPFSTESFCFPFSIVLRCDVQLVFGSSLLKVTSWNSLDFEISRFPFFAIFGSISLFLVQETTRFPPAPNVTSVFYPWRRHPPRCPCWPWCRHRVSRWAALNWKLGWDWWDLIWFQDFSLEESYLYRISFYNLMFSNIHQFSGGFFSSFFNPDWLKWGDGGSWCFFHEAQWDQ